MTGAEELQEQIESLYGGHPGISLILQGFELILADTNLNVDQTKLLIADLAAFDTGHVAGILPLVVQHLAGPDNKALEALTDPQRKEAQKLGEEYVLVTSELSQSQIASDVVAALDMPEGRCPDMADEEKSLSDKVREVNKRSENRPRNN